METKKLEKYLIKKGEKTNMLSSLKKLNQEIVKEKLEFYDVKTLEELSSSIIEEFEDILDSSKDDIFTQMFFDKLLRNENSMIFSAYESDVEKLFVFVYDKGNYYTYYIPDEIKKTIQKLIK